MRKTKKLLLLLSAFLPLAALTACMGSHSRPAHLIDHEHDYSVLKPSIEAAYKQQQSLITSLVGKRIIGYKAGLTSDAGQQKFNVSEPVAGVLFQSGLSHQRNKYQLSRHHKLMIETEIGFILKAPITQPITAENLAQYIDSVVPVIELPDLPYDDLSAVTGEQLISDNVASNSVLMGSPVPYSSVDINAIQTVLEYKGAPVIHGESTDAMHDQKSALVWLINRLLQSGYTLEQGHLLITGALGAMIPAEKGQYEARFTGLSTVPYTLAFSIVD